jgi:hypothetical protein
VSTRGATEGRSLLKIESADYSFPIVFPSSVKSLIHRILDPNPDTRIRIEDIRNDEWFKKNYEPIREVEDEELNLDDVNAAFNDPQEDTEHTIDDEGPLTLNAFDLIILSQGLNLAALFDRRQVFMQATCDTGYFTKKLFELPNVL